MKGHNPLFKWPTNQFEWRTTRHRSRHLCDERVNYFKIITITYHSLLKRVSVSIGCRRPKTKTRFCFGRFFPSNLKPVETRCKNLPKWKHNSWIGRFSPPTLKPVETRGFNLPKWKPCIPDRPINSYTQKNIFPSVNSYDSNEVGTIYWDYCKI